MFTLPALPDHSYGLAGDFYPSSSEVSLINYSKKERLSRQKDYNNLSHMVIMPEVSGAITTLR